MLSELEALEVEDLVGRYGAIPHTEFQSRREEISAAVSLPLVERAALRHPNPHYRRGCLGLLDSLGGQESVPTLLSALRDPVPGVRRSALHALTCEHCKVDPLETDIVSDVAQVAEHDENARTRHAAVITLLIRQSDSRARQVLSRISRHDPDDRVRQTAALGLGGARLSSLSYRRGGPAARR